MPKCSTIKKNNVVKGWENMQELKKVIEMEQYFPKICYNI
ncbi:hypothetical protein A0O32_1895 [Anoxybacillus flavithermus]|nr:hypothetical protein A0O32_1895 [Anoxybacillus flavithermus]